MTVRKGCNRGPTGPGGSVWGRLQSGTTADTHRVERHSKHPVRPPTCCLTVVAPTISSRKARRVQAGSDDRRGAGPTPDHQAAAGQAGAVSFHLGARVTAVHPRRRSRPRRALIPALMVEWRRYPAALQTVISTASRQEWHREVPLSGIGGGTYTAAAAACSSRAPHQMEKFL